MWVNLSSTLVNKGSQAQRVHPVGSHAGEVSHARVLPQAAVDGDHRARGTSGLLTVLSLQNRAEDTVHIFVLKIKTFTD